MDDAAARCKPVLVDDDRTLGRGGDEDGLNQYMDAVTWKVFVVGLQEEVGHVIPDCCNRDIGFGGGTSDQNHDNGLRRYGSVGGWTSR